MRKLLTIAATAAFFTTLALAENYSGKLMDSSCIDQKKEPATCQATANTTAFSVVVSGKLLKFDDAGNQKAAKALRDRADRAADPAAAAAPVSAKVTGTLDGDVIKVDSIEVQ
jgi:hypothetical protein